MLGLIPGMPNLVFCCWRRCSAPPPGGWRRRPEAEPQALPEAAAAAAAIPQEAQGGPAGPNVTPVDVLGLEVGYRLIPLVDKNQDAELLRRIRGLRKKIRRRGGLPHRPGAHPRQPGTQAQRLPHHPEGRDGGRGRGHPGSFLAINPGRVVGALPGRETAIRPSACRPCGWRAACAEQAHAFGSTWVDAATVVATHLNHVILANAADLLGRQESQALLDHLAKEQPKLVEDLVPKQIALAALQRVLQNLLEEGVGIRDMRTIIETIAEHAPAPGSDRAHRARARRPGPLHRAGLFPGNGEMQVLVLDPSLERILMQAVGNGGEGAALEPGLADALLQQAAAVATGRSHGPAGGAAGAHAAAYPAVALSTPFRAHAEGAGQRRSARFPNPESDRRDRR